MFIGSYYIVLCTIKLPSCKQRCRQLWNLKVGRSRWWRHSWWHHRAVLNFKKKNGWCCLTRARTDIKITKETVYHCYSSCEMFSHPLYYPPPPPPPVFFISYLRELQNWSWRRVGGPNPTFPPCGLATGWKSIWYIWGKHCCYCDSYCKNISHKFHNFAVINYLQHFLLNLPEFTTHPP